MGFHADLLLQFTPSEDLNAVSFTDNAVIDQRLNADAVCADFFSKTFQDIQVHRLEVFLVGVLEPEFRNTALQGHLAAFKADLLGVARTRLGALVTAAGGRAARSLATPAALVRPYRSLCRFECVQFHLQASFTVTR